MNTIATVILIGSMLFSNMANAVTITTTTTTLCADGTVRKEVTVKNVKGEIVDHYVAVPFDVCSETIEP